MVSSSFLSTPKKKKKKEIQEPIVIEPLQASISPTALVIYKASKRIVLPVHTILVVFLFKFQFFRFSFFTLERWGYPEGIGAGCLGVAVTRTL